MTSTSERDRQCGIIVSCLRTLPTWLCEEAKECLCVDYSDHNISNNGQHLYRHCHERSPPVQHDKLFLDHGVESSDVHDLPLNKATDEIDINEGRLALNALDRESGNKTEGADKEVEDVCDDVEIIIFLEKGSEEIRVDVVSKTFIPAENQLILSTSFEKPENKNCYDLSKNFEKDLNEKKEEKCDSSEKMLMAKDSKHVHFQKQTAFNHQHSLRSHKMEKEYSNDISCGEKTREYHEKFAQRDTCKVAYYTGKRTSVNTLYNDYKYNAMTHKRPTHNSELKTDVHGQRTMTRASSSECDLNNKPDRNRNAILNVSNEKKIILLRRDCESKTIPIQTTIKMGESNENGKDRNSYLMNNTIEIHQKHNNRDTSKLRNTVQVSSSQINATHSAGDTTDARRSKSTLNADNTKKMSTREREKQKKRQKSKKRQYKNKIPKTEKEIFQRQVETGQLRSMFSRYKTDSLKYLKLQELLHKGTFSTKYKGSFQNKQVVLTIYSEDLTNDINAIDMAHMGNSYFVLGFTDCMTGPFGVIWFMSMYHNIGDLQQILSRDPNRHVIGERHSQFITAGVLIGVDYLHQHEIIHGNIKPSKVLINALGYPVLTGFVKMTDNPDREGNQAYTPAYVAPEQLRGNRSEAIDIFSVGCMAYEIITGWTPFDGETREQTLLNIQKTCRPVYDPESFSFAGEFFIDSCLRRNPKERFCIGEERCNLTFEEWFSTLNWRDLRRQLLRSPVIDALQQIENRTRLAWEDKTVQFKWGQVMDVMCPYTPSLEPEEDLHSSFV